MKNSSNHLTPKEITDIMETGEGSSHLRLEMITKAFEHTKKELKETGVNVYREQKVHYSDDGGAFEEYKKEFNLTFNSINDPHCRKILACVAESFLNPDLNVYKGTYLKIIKAGVDKASYQVFEDNQRGVHKGRNISSIHVGMEKSRIGNEVRRFENPDK